MIFVSRRACRAAVCPSPSSGKGEVVGGGLGVVFLPRLAVGCGSRAARPSSGRLQGRPRRAASVLSCRSAITGFPNCRRLGLTHGGIQDGSDGVITSTVPVITASARRATPASPRRDSPEAMTGDEIRRRRGGGASFRAAWPVTLGDVTHPPARSAADLVHALRRPASDVRGACCWPTMSELDEGAKLKLDSGFLFPSLVLPSHAGNGRRGASWRRTRPPTA